MTKAPGVLPDSERVDEIIADQAGTRGALLPILHALQSEFGYIDDATAARVGLALNISRADVHGVVTFYHDFRRDPPGAHVLKICSAEACQSRGAAELIAQAEQWLGTPMKSTTRDGAVTLEPVYCLGLCAVAPAAMLDGQVCGRLTRERFQALLSQVRP